MSKYHFTNHQLLGQGGFSDVYRAINTHDNQSYAIKTFRLPTGGEERQRVLRYYQHEAQALSSFRHPHIVRCIDHYIQDNGEPIIIMPTIAGVSLQEYIDTQGIIEADIAHHIAKQMAQALQCCHQGHVVHNDLHPRNILCTLPTEAEKGTTVPHCTLIDFGLSFPIGQPLTMWEKEQGLKDYKAPEKWTHDTLTPATDIYAFGVLLYTLFAGRPPFVCTDYSDSEAEEHLRQQCLYATPVSLWTLRSERYEELQGYAPSEPDLPLWWSYIAQKCLHKDPSLRYATASELLEDIMQGEAGLLETEALGMAEHDSTEPIPVVPITITQPDTTSEPEFVSEPKSAPASLSTESLVSPSFSEPKHPEPVVQLPPLSMPPVRKSKGGFLVLFIILLVAGLGVGTYFGISYLLEQREQSTYTDLIKDYYRHDVVTLDDAHLDTLMTYFEYPVYYYTKEYDDAEAFRKNYRANMRKTITKDLNIYSIKYIPERSTSNYCVVEMEGEYSFKQKSGKTITRELHDVIHIRKSSKRIIEIRNKNED